MASLWPTFTVKQHFWFCLSLLFGNCLHPACFPLLCEHYIFSMASSSGNPTPNPDYIARRLSLSAVLLSLWHSTLSSSRFQDEKTGLCLFNKTHVLSFHQPPPFLDNTNPALTFLITNFFPHTQCIKTHYSLLCRQLTSFTSFMFLKNLTQVKSLILLI